MARATKYSSKLVDRIVKAIQVGCTYELAAKYAGISYETFRVWRETKPAFSVLIEKAEGEAAARWLGRIEQASQDGQWQAAAWKLERRYPREYGRTVQQHEGPDGGPVRHVIVERIERLDDSSDSDSDSSNGE